MILINIRTSSAQIKHLGRMLAVGQILDENHYKGYFT